MGGGYQVTFCGQAVRQNEFKLSTKAKLLDITRYAAVFACAARRSVRIP